jgi:hypothetical protein
MSDIFSTPDDGGDLKSSDFTTSMADRLGAQWADTLDPKNSLSGMWLARQARQSIAGGEDLAAFDVDAGQVEGQSVPSQKDSIAAARDAIPDISQTDAKGLLKQEGLSEQDVHLGDAPSHKLPVLKMQIEEAHTRRDRAAAIARGPQGFFPDALGAVTSIGVGMIDPVNAAAFSIPVIGEARMGKIIASAGDSILARGAARFGQGAVQGAVGTAVLQPADWWLHTRDGQDYTMAQAMESIIMGAGMGGTFHAIPGGVRDVLARRRGDVLEGSPQDLLLRGLMTGTHVHADQLAEEGVPLHDVPGIGPDVVPQPDRPFPGDVPLHPAEVMADLPQAVRQDTIHAAMADVIAGRPTQAAELLQIAADHDPRIAESFEAWHGSPHDFDRFDLSKIGTGEGAQAYGHGLYFAQKEDVARDYQEQLGRPLIGGKSADPTNATHVAAAFLDEYKSHEAAIVQLDKEINDSSQFALSPAEAEAARGARKLLEQRSPLPAVVKNGGHLYKVRISANHEHMLDWDLPLDEQHEHVRKTLLEHPDQSVSGTASKWGHDIPALYSRLSQRLAEHVDENGESWGAQGPSVASKALREAGIPGIKYLDRGSRRPFAVIDKHHERVGPIEFDTREDAQSYIEKQIGFGEDPSQFQLKEVPQTRNFVVFDDKHIEITHKNGEPVKKEELVKEHALQQAKANAAKSPRGRAAADPKTWSLFEYLASRGSLKPDPELAAIFGNGRGPFVPGFGPLIRKGGMALDDALVAAKEGAYVHDVDQLHAPHGLVDAARRDQPLTVDINDLLRLFDENARDQKTYRADHVADTKHDPAHESHLVLSELEHELEASGAKVEDIDPKLLDRTVEIVKRDGETDVLAAYERAIMEDAERYDATAHQRQSDAETSHIPGWDAHDLRPAPGDGQGGPGERGQAGRPDQRARGADGQESRSPGGSDRSSHAVAAADPRWRELADATPDYNEPDVLAESEAASHVPEPDSVQPVKSLTALEKAAADAEEVWRQLEPTLTEQERALVNTALDQLKLDAEARSKIITDGVTCLAGAIG